MNYVKIRMGKTTERGEFHYNNGDYNGVLWWARVSRSESPSTLEEILYLHRLCLFR